MNARRKPGGQKETSGTNKGRKHNARTQERKADRRTDGNEERKQKRTKQGKGRTHTEKHEGTSKITQTGTIYIERNWELEWKNDGNKNTK